MSVSTLTCAADLDAIEPGKTAVVKFFATWCGPCKAFAPIFEREAGKTDNEQLDFAQADIEIATDLAEQFGVQTIPTIRALTKTETGELEVQVLEWPITPANFKEFLAQARS